MSEYFEHYKNIQKTGATIITLVTCATAKAIAKFGTMDVNLYLNSIKKRDNPL